MRSYFIVVPIFYCVLSGCQGTPRISALHDPLYRAESHTSTITAKATETRDGISQIALDLMVGTITACDGGPAIPSLIPCRTNARASNFTCDYPALKTEVSCAISLRLGARQIVTYSATTRSAGNRTASTGPVTYAAGAPITQATVRFVFVNFTLPWETARPVIWRTDAPSRSVPRGDKIDWGFVPDSDMPSYRAFTDDMQPMVKGLFYTDTNAFSQWTRAFKNTYNIWAGPTGGNGEGCTRTFAAPASTVRGAFDGTAILHRNAFRDCASISLGGGAGTAQTNLSDATWVMNHESGHFLYGLGDEYVGGGNSSISTPKNVFSSQSACQSASTGIGLPSGQCAQIGSTGTWRNDDLQATTMEDRVLNSDWRTLAGKAMGTLLNKCNSGACY